MTGVARIAEFAPTGLARLARVLEGKPLDRAVPSSLWRRALVGPATEFLVRPGKELRTSIIDAGYLLGGGTERHAPSAIADALELLHAGSLIVDDVEDSSEERRGAPALHVLVGAPLAINTGSWMYFAALDRLATLALPGALERAVATLARCHEGQALDLAVRVDELDGAYCPSVVEAITRLKTGALCRLAAELGALAAGAPAAQVARAGDFAEGAGTALQMLDDLGSLVAPARRAKGHEDLRGARATWPWAWLAEHDELAYSRLARAVATTPIDELADKLGAAVVDVGRARCRATLAAALSLLPETPAGAAIADSLRRMEVAYG